MKKIVSLVLMTLTLFSCMKRDTDMLHEQEVTFNAWEVHPLPMLKSTNDVSDFDCIEGISPDYARIVITGFDDPFLPMVFTLDGHICTQAIKLLAGTYSIEQFLFMDDQGTPDNLDDDSIYMAIPETGSDFAIYTDPSIPFNIQVGEFIKTDIPIEVLCYQSSNYGYFGFDWFSPNQITIREQCFFGDICVNPDDYLTSLYDLEQLPVGCQVDMPAIIQIAVTLNGDTVPYSPFTNATLAAGYGVGAPLCVWYPDDMLVTGEVFTFDLYVLVKSTVPGTFLYQLYHTFQVTDDGTIENGGDGIIDFAIGDCSMGADYVFTWLPPPEPPIK